MTDASLKITPLNQWHLDQGAQMAEFGGYHMPLWYPTGIKQEHLAVVTSAGLFDTSHMAPVMVAGADARGLLQACFTKDLEACIGKGPGPLAGGRSVYGAFLDKRGHVIDDAIIFQLTPESYMVVVNAGMGARIADHLMQHRELERRVQVNDLTDQLGKIDIQGPAAAKILAPLLTDPQRVFDHLVYFSFKGHFDSKSPDADAVRMAGDIPVMLSRTGYTGEFGFELFVDRKHAAAVWEALLGAGEAAGHNLIPCGLGARDSLRAGAVLPLSHQDIGDWPYTNHPWPFALPWDAEKKAFTKAFVGDRALLENTETQTTLAFAGNDPRKVTAGPESAVLDTQGEPIGTVLTCVTDMAIGRVDGRIVSVASPDRPESFSPRGLSCGFVRVNAPLDVGQPVSLRGGRRTIQAVIVDDIRPHRSARRPIKDMT
jgi:aminomethyltransferase